MLNSYMKSGCFVPIVRQIIRHCFSFQLPVFIQPVVGAGIRVWHFAGGLRMYFGGV